MSSPLAIARRLIERGFTPVPIPHRSKAPTLRDWPQLRLTAEEAVEHFNGAPQNIGILLGEASGNLVDIDLDCPEAIAAAAHLLPATPWVTGRESAPRSHYWYRTPAPLKSETFDDPTGGDGPHGGRLLELRATGQTLSPPSTHPSGEPVIAYGNLRLDPAHVISEDLARAVRRVAAAALIARHWPKGHRHDAALALAGALRRVNWARDDAERFLAAAADAAGDAEARDRTAAVEATYTRDGATTGTKRLTEIVDRRIVDRVMVWLGVRSPKTPRVREIPPYSPFPAEALPSPLREFVIETAAALGVDHSYIALPALAVVAAAIGNTRAIRLKRGWLEPCLLWTAILGDSGTLKTPAYMKTVEPLLDAQAKLIKRYRGEREAYEAELDAWTRARKSKHAEDAGERPIPPRLERVIVSDTTIERLSQSLEDNPRGVLLGRDELGGWLGSFRRYRGRDVGSDLQTWLEIYRAATINYERKTGERNLVYVPRANVSVTGGIQPGVMARAMSDGEYLESGLAARLIMAMPPKTPKKWTEAEIDDATESGYRDLLNRLRDLDCESEGAPYVLSLDAEAKAIWIRFYNAWAREQADSEGDLAAAFSKLEGAAARLALIDHVVRCVHAGKDDRRPVTADSVEAGAKIAAWAGGEVRRIYSMFGECPEDREIRRLVEFIRSRGGRITVRALQRSNSRKYPDGESAKAVLDRLAEAGVGDWTEPEVPAGGGHTRVYLALRETPRPTHDTSDTRFEEDDEDGGEPVRHSPDTRTRTPTFSSGKMASVGSVMRRRSDLAPDAAGQVGGAECRTDWASVGAPPSTLIDRPEDLALITAGLDETELVGIDTETSGLDPRTHEIRLLSLAVDGIDGPHVYILDLNAVDPAPLWRILSEKTLIGHNLQFDLGFLARRGFDAPSKLVDTMLASQLLHAGDRTERHSLAECCKRELGIEVDKTLQSCGWSETLTPQHLEYAALDAELPRRLYAAIQPKLAEGGLVEVFDLECRALPTIARLAAAGVGFDAEAWRNLAGDAETEQDRLKAELDALAPARGGGLYDAAWNWDSPTEIKTALAAAGVAITATDDDTLAAVDHPLTCLLRRYRSAAKRVGTYGAAWLKHVADNGRVYASWRQIGADSGRMTCREPNLQQLPRDPRYRRCFTAPQGRVIVKADYSQIELRIAAKIADETAMIEAYKRGDDLHAMTAELIIGNNTVTNTDRQLAKALNFGLLYGMGAVTLQAYCRSSYGLEIMLENAKRYRASFFKTYPKLRRWHARAGGDRGGIDTRTIAGRRRRNVQRFTERLNTPVQGTAADGLKAALALLWERRAEHPTAVPILAVHDEIVIECDELEADAVANWLKCAMIDGMAPFADPVPVEVEVTIGATWGGD